MPDLQRVRCIWSGFPGAPGVSTFYFPPPLTPPLSAIKSFWGTLANFLPTGVSVLVENQGDVINELNGQLVGSWSGTVQTATTGLGTGGYTGPSGAIIRWTTGGIANGRRIKGRTFVVPIAQSALTGTGVISPANVATLTTAAGNFIQACDPKPRIWHRPVGGTGGTSGVIESGAAQPLSAVLRSRRD